MDSEQARIFDESSAVLHSFFLRGDAMTTRKYQYGDLQVRNRKKGPAVWQFRFIENGRRKSVLVGTVEKLPTQADAERAVEGLRSQVNAQNPQSKFHSVTVGGLIDRFMKEYAPKHCRLNTRNVYLGAFNKHIRPRWGDNFVQDVKTLAVQEWLDEYPHSRQVKSHLRKYLHVLFNQAIRWEVIDRNPITLVKQAGKRMNTPRVLTREEFKALVGQLVEPFKTMVITIACLGLRVCELMALKWGDVCFEKLQIRIQRSIVAGEVNLTKNDASETTLPLDPELAGVLLEHRILSVYNADSDFVFCTCTGHPMWKDTVLARVLKPAATAAGIGNIGWHTFRHSYRVWLKQFKAPLDVQKQLMRHANLKTTVEIYGIESEVPDEMREANGQVVKSLLGS
jgi:integrase